MRKIGLCIASGYRQLLWLDDSAHDEYHDFILILAGFTVHGALLSRFHRSMQLEAWRVRRVDWRDSLVTRSAAGTTL